MKELDSDVNLIETSVSQTVWFSEKRKDIAWCSSLQFILLLLFFYIVFLFFLHGIHDPIGCPAFWPMTLAETDKTQMISVAW